MSPLVRIPAPALWTPELVQQLLEDENDEFVKANADYIHGDHWRSGLGWIGPRVDGDTHTDELIKRGFVSRNLILEVARRHSEGVSGNEPDWGLLPRRRMAESDKPNAQEQDLIDEVEAALTDWWDERAALERLAEAVEQTTWARRGTLRLYVPEGLLPASGQLPQAATLADALQFIYIESVPYNQGLVFTDVATKRQVGAVLFENENGRSVLEWTWLKNPADPRSPALINQVEQGQQARPEPFELNLGGRLPILEIRVPRLLCNRQLQEIQRVMNLALSVIPRNIITAGFLERIFLNAQMPGTWETDPTTGRKTIFKPAPYVTGPNTTSFVQGSEQPDEISGITKIGQPQVVFREPIPVNSTVEAKHSAYEDALEEAEQVHILIEGAATPSGVSRQEARAGYERSLRRTQRPTQRAGRGLVLGVTAFAEAIMRKPGFFTGRLRSHFDCRLDLGPVSPDDQRVAGELAAQDLLSEPTTMVRVGIQDPDAEIARRNASPRGKLDLKTKQLTALDAGTKIPAATIEGVGEFIGLTTEEVATLTRGTPSAPKDPQGNPTMPPEPVPGVPRGPVQQ